MSWVREPAAVRLGVVVVLALHGFAAARLGQPNATLPRGTQEANVVGQGNATPGAVAAAAEDSAGGIVGDAEPAPALQATAGANGSAELEEQVAVALAGRGAARAASNLSLTAAASRSTFGYSARASTTRYGNTGYSSCGSMNTADLVAGTGYYSVATSQAMQSLFKGGDSCCYCGSGASWAWSKGTAAMGCFTCARGRFLHQRPYNGMNAMGGFASSEIRIVVADVCPGDAEGEGWCQAAPGHVNMLGETNHLDFSVPPPGIDNNFFVFTPEECSPQLKARMSSGKGRCRR